MPTENSIGCAPSGVPRFGPIITSRFGNMMAPANRASHHMYRCVRYVLPTCLICSSIGTILRVASLRGRQRKFFDEQRQQRPKARVAGVAPIRLDTTTRPPTRIAAVAGQTHGAIALTIPITALASDCGSIVHLHKDFFEVEIVDRNIGVPRLAHFAHQSLIKIGDAHRGMRTGHFAPQCTRHGERGTADRGEP